MADLSEDDPAQRRVQEQLQHLLYSTLRSGVSVIRATARVAELRFAQLEAEAFLSWSTNPETQAATFAVRVQEIRMQVTSEISQLWQGQEEWYEQFCRPAPDGVDATLAKLVNQSVSKAHRAEARKTSYRPGPISECIGEQIPDPKTDRQAGESEGGDVVKKNAAARPSFHCNSSSRPSR